MVDPSLHIKDVSSYTVHLIKTILPRYLSPIDIQTSVLAKSKIAKYQNALEKIIDIVIYHGRQGNTFQRTQRRL